MYFIFVILFLSNPGTIKLEKIEDPFIPGFSVCAEGNVYCLNRWDNKCYVYRIETGEFLQSFVEKGQGPGELEAASHIFLNNSEEILIASMISQTANLYDLEGNFLRKVTWGGGGWPVHASNESVLYVRGEEDGWVSSYRSEKRKIGFRCGPVSKRSKKTNYANGMVIAHKILNRPWLLVSDPFRFEPYLYSTETGQKLKNFYVEGSVLREWDGEENMPENSIQDLHDWFETFDWGINSFSFEIEGRVFIAICWRRANSTEKYITQIFNQNGELVDLFFDKDMMSIGFHANQIILMNDFETDENVMIKQISREIK